MWGDEAKQNDYLTILFKKAPSDTFRTDMIVYMQKNDLRDNRDYSGARSYVVAEYSDAYQQATDLLAAT